MVITHRSWRLIALLATIALLVGLTATAEASSEASHSYGEWTVFERRGPEEVSPSGHSVLADCQAPGAEDPDGWVSASARLKFGEAGGKSWITIDVRDARPDTYYTVWLRLGGTDSNGDPFGGNPLTGGKATPLAASSDLQTLLRSTGSGNGNDEQPNGFRTNERGRATFRVLLDFPVHAGAYPFQRFPEWDPADPRLPAADPAIYPVAIAGPQGPYTLRIVSHCTDGAGHGLTSGPREWWFDWTIPS